MNPIIKEIDFRREIKSAPRPCYFFFGEEDYLKNAALKLARTTLGGDPAFDIFNYTVIDGREYTADKLLDALAPPPMMADRKLVILQDIDLIGIKQSDFQELCTALSALEDYDYNTLIITTAADGFAPGNLPKRPSAQLSALAELAVPVQFDRSTPAKLAAWAQKHYAAHGANASPEVAAYTVDYCGRDMFALAFEIDKVACYALSHGRTEINRSDVETVATPANEYGAFAFANAITEGRRAEALQILDDMKFRRIEPLIIMGEIIGIYSELLSVKTLADKGYSAPEIAAELKMNEYKLARYLKSVRNISTARVRATVCAAALADAELKSGAKGYAPLEKLICS
ncbi:MAG: DNA polymerase III subunit delta [Clostridia bacterium]|nr:DNA polymerase III subunit delta [Clostridia bacterium]